LVVTNDDERNLWPRQMEADIVNKMTDVECKRTLMRWEPWKAMSAAFTAGILVASALAGLFVWIGAHWVAH
jgi:hypothetical protein